MVKTAAMLVAVAIGVSACGSARPAARPNRPIRVTQVPSSLPAGGVKVQDVVLTPWAVAPSGAMSEHKAIAAALVFANKAKSFPAKALQADLTLPGNAAKDHVPVWVVTFTSPKAVDVSQG